MERFGPGEEQSPGIQISQSLPGKLGLWALPWWVSSGLPARPKKAHPVWKHPWRHLPFSLTGFIFIKTVSAMLNIVCQHAGLQYAWIFWVRLWGCFWMRLTFESVGWVKQTGPRSPASVGGPCLIHWRPGRRAGGWGEANSLSPSDCLRAAFWLEPSHSLVLRPSDSD